MARAGKTAAGDGRASWAEKEERMRAVTKTIVIGIGGTGLLGALYAKKQLLEVYGEVPPTFKFLVFDTAPQIPLQLEGGELRFEDGVEFFHFTVDRVKNVIKHEDIARWFDPAVPVSAIKNGAGQKRHVGRVSLFRHYSEIKAAIQRVERELTHFSIDLAVGDKYAIADERIGVYIIASIAGGTGAGFFLDLGFILRSVLPDDASLRAFLVLPDIYKNGAYFTDRVNMNAYGSLLELDQFMNITRGSAMTHRIATEEIKIDEPPFDWVILVDDKSRGEASYDSPKQLAEMIGLAIFTLAGQVGEQVASIWDNAKDCLDRSWSGKKTKYCGLGVAELVYQPGRTVSARAARLAKQVCDELAQAGAADVDREVEQFIDLNRLKESGRDDVIDAILEPNQAIRFQQTLSKKNHAQVVAQLEPWLRTRDSDYRAKGRVNQAALALDRSQRLEAHLCARVHAPSGPAAAEKFLERLIAFLTAYKSEMESEKAKLLEGARAVKKERETLAKQMVPEAAKRVFGNALEECGKKLCQNLSATSAALYEVARRDLAVEFYAELIAVAGQRLAQTAALRQKIGAVATRLTERLVSLEREAPGARPFTIAISPDPAQLEAMQAGARGFLEELAASGKNLIELAGLRDSELEALFTGHLDGLDATQALGEKSLERVIADMLAADVGLAQKWIKRIDKAAEPLLRYNDDLRPGDEPPPQTLYCIGVESSSRSVLADDPRLSVLFKGAKQPSVVATNDPKRIILLKLEAAVPAFALEQIADYREDYLKAKNDPAETIMVYHLSREWYHDKFGRFEGKFDLLPAKEESGERLYWSLGLALSNPDAPFIHHRASSYFFTDAKLGEPPDHELLIGQGRRRAMENFLNDDALLGRAKERVDAAIKEQGPKKAKETLAAYLDQGLKPRIPGREAGQDDLRRLLLDELNDLEGFIKEL